MVEIIEESTEMLAAYGEIPIAFQVVCKLRVEVLDQGLGGIRFIEEEVEEPYFKNYDLHEKPERWAKMWDVSNWGVLSAFDQGQRIGGAVIAWKTDGLRMLEGRENLAVLWDIRVHPDCRRQGVGTSLFNKVAKWARARECRQLKIETQNINLPACRFYAQQGCTLGAVHRRAYLRYPEEVQLFWYFDL
jgi:ribosomal protein S18 acetylase RimI-like enzyme